MDTIDNLIYTTRNLCNYPTPGVGVQASPALTSNLDNVGIDLNGAPILDLPTINVGNTNFFYTDIARVSFAIFRDSQLIEDAMEKHGIVKLTRRRKQHDATNTGDLLGTEEADH